jgi:hypothetical protein
MLKSKWVGLLYAMGQRPSACGLQTDLVVAAQPAKPSRLSFGRSTSILAAMLAMLAGSNSTVFASAGCDAVNSHRLDFFVQANAGHNGGKVSGFVAGDQVTLHVTRVGGGTTSARITDSNFGIILIDDDSNAASATVSYTVTGNSDTTLTDQAKDDGTVTSTNVVATCIPATSSSSPTVSGLSPNSGPVAGGTSVAITGTGFTGATVVKFGGANATAFSVNSATSITATAPAGFGTVDIAVTTPAGTSTISVADRFTYVAGASVVALSSSSNPSQAGQPVTFTSIITGSVGTPTGTVTFKDGGTVLRTVSLLGGTASFTTSSLSVGSHSMTATYNGDSNFLAATSVVLQQAVGVPTDSLKLRNLQIEASKLVAQTSGAAISGAIDGAISDAFSATGGTPVAVGPNGFTVNFASEPQSDVMRRTDEAFSALGYAGNISTKVPPRIERDWSVWADVRGTGFERNDALADTHGNQLNVTGGIGYKFAPDLLAGVFTGYEHFNYTVESLSGKLSGDGGTVGAYAAYRFAPHWRVDGALGWSDVAYAARAGTAAGSFTGSRWLATGALTGDYRYGGFVIEPSARIYALWESENAYTDSLGTLQAARNFSEGRVAAGGKVIYPWQATSDLLVSPYVGLYGDYRFSSDTALPVGIAFVGIKDGWSERVTGGLTMKSGLAGPSLSLGAELGGLGAGYDLWSANARMNWPF